jgi:hypothetical protein
VTLNTSIVIGRPYNVHEVFAYCRVLLNTPEDAPVLTGPKPGEERDYRPGQKWIYNPGGIGVDAWLWIYYGADGPMVHEHDEYCATEPGGEFGYTQADVGDHSEDVRQTPTENGWGAIEVTFDTAYGYRSDEGENCSQLHARLVAQLGNWLDERGLPWKWQNEYTGEWFDRYDGLDEFVNAHKSTGAADWFDNIVLPLIEHGVRGGPVSA